MASPEFLYLHVPFCARKCPYCGFFSTAGRDDLIPAYVDAVLRELEAAPRSSEFRGIYIGGGTPTMLPPQHLADLLDGIRRMVTLADDCEFTVEVNPGTLDADKAAVMRAAGVNRASLGAQSFQHETLELLGRIHGPGEITAAVRQLRDAGINNISLDLIYAVPGQKVRQFRDDIRQAVELGADHISTYGLSFDEGTPFEHALQTGKMSHVSDDLYLQMYETANDLITSAGLEHYEISNFARPGRHSVHNCNYWLNGQYLGLGASATAFVDGERRTNIADVEEYIRQVNQCGIAPAFSERLEPEAFARETAAFNIRYLPGIERESFRQRTGYALDDLYNDAVRQCMDDGLLSDDGAVVRLTHLGLMLADSVSAAFLK